MASLLLSLLTPARGCLFLFVNAAAWRARTQSRFEQTLTAEGDVAELLMFAAYEDGYVQALRMAGEEGTVQHSLAPEAFGNLQLISIAVVEPCVGKCTAPSGPPAAAQDMCDPEWVRRVTVPVGAHRACGELIHASWSACADNAPFVNGTGCAHTHSCLPTHYSSMHRRAVEAASEHSTAS